MMVNGHRDLQIPRQVFPYCEELLFLKESLPWSRFFQQVNDRTAHHLAMLQTQLVGRTQDAEFTVELSIDAHSICHHGCSRAPWYRKRMYCSLRRVCEQAVPRPRQLA